MFTLPILRYEYNALEPVIDEATMRIHHSKHHQVYVDKLNAAVEGTEYEFWTLEKLLSQYETIEDPIRSAIRNHGGGHANHSMFREIMCP
jgi:Fe-Mn family superoxide dismutase